MATVPEDTRSVQVGQHVVLQIGRNELRATVLEDRGPLGTDGHHVFRVSVDLGDDVERADYEVPETALRPAA